MTDHGIAVDIKNGIATVTFNRPTHMNTLDAEFAHQFALTTESLAHNHDVHAVILKGAGDCFCAGGDIHFFYERLDKMPEGVLSIVRQVNASVLNISKMPKPVIAAVHGSVAGVGLSFMLACDLVVAAEGTQFTTAYNKIGITPDGGATFFLTQLVGKKKATELLWFSDRFDSVEAKELGLINYVVSPAQLMKHAEKLATQLIKGPKRAFANTKRLIREAERRSLSEQLELEAQSFVELSATEDFKIGVRAFVNKSVSTGEKAK